MRKGRDYLNRTTREGHKAVEAAFDVFDMETAEGMHSILTAHIAAMDRLLSALDHHEIYSAEIGRLRELAFASREALQTPRAPAPRRNAERLHPLAVAYVVLGSRLGARVLSRRLDRLATRWNDQVCDYFSDEGSGPAWALLCAELESLSDTDAIEDIAADAQRVFALYHEEARALAPSASMAYA